MKKNMIFLISLFIVFSILFVSCSAGGGGANPPNNPPNAPTNVFPPDGATGISLKPTLMWKCSDPDGDPLVYDLYFGTSESNLQLLIGNIQNTSYAITEDLSYSTTYYWKVVAKDDSGASTEGPVWSFTTMQRANIPPHFEFLSPDDGAIDQPLNLILRWHAVDPDPNASITYDLYFGMDSKNLSIIMGNTTDEMYQFGVNGHINLNYSTTYYWKVVVRDEKGATVDSGVRSFTTIGLPNTPPQGMVYISPGEDETFNQGDEVTLEWRAEDLDGDKLYYRVYFGPSGDMKLLLSDYEDVRYIIDTTKLEPGKTYCFRVDATDGKDWEYGDIRCFEIAPAPPTGTLDLITPLGSGQPVRKLRFVWKAPAGYDPNKGEIRYTLYFDTRSNPAVYETELMQNCFELPIRLEYNKTYYWRVESYGAVSAKSIIGSFKTAPKMPPEVELLYPQNNTTVNRANVPLEWRVNDPNNDKWRTLRLYYRKVPITNVISTKIHEISGPFNCDWNESKCSFVFPVGLIEASATYEWWVSVKDETGEVATSTHWIFKTK